MNIVTNFLTSPTVTLLVVILINIFGAWLAFIVYSANSKAINNKLLAWWMLPTILFIDLGYLSSISELFYYSLYLKRLRFGSVAVFFMIGYFFFCVYFPKKRKGKMVLDIVHTMSWVVILFFTIFTGFMIKDIKLEPWGIDAVFGNGMLIYYSLTFISIFLFLQALFKKYFILSEEYKTKILYFLTGTCIYALFNLIFNIAFPIFYKSMHYYQFGDYSAIFFFGFIAYAIIKKQLFGIKIILTQALVVIIAILLLTQSIIVIPNWFEFSWKLALFFLFLVFGLLLIRSVKNEIKQRKRMENMAKQLDKANDKLEKVNIKLVKLDEAKSEFISIASHQLRTPLTVIKGYISMILEGNFGEVNYAATDSLEKVYESNERLIQLVENLLNISRIESGRLQFNYEVIYLEDLVDSVVEELEISAKKKGLKFTYKKPAKKLPKVKIDQEKIRQVVMNLIDNSIKYTRKGSVTVSLRKTGETIEFCVSDSGMGIKKEDMKGLFKKFVRGTGTSLVHTEGTGLGLYVADQMIKSHGGRVWAESAGEGRGAKFRFVLPKYKHIKKNPKS